MRRFKPGPTVERYRIDAQGERSRYRDTLEEAQMVARNLSMFGRKNVTITRKVQASFIRESFPIRKDV